MFWNAFLKIKNRTGKLCRKNNWLNYCHLCVVITCSSTVYGTLFSQRKKQIINSSVYLGLYRRSVNSLIFRMPLLYASCVYVVILLVNNRVINLWPRATRVWAVINLDWRDYYYYYYFVDRIRNVYAWHAQRARVPYRT